MRFDPRSAKLLQPGEHLLVDGCPGLRLACNATRKTWTYRYEIDGRMKQKAFGHWPEMPLHQAVEEWGKLRSPESKRQIKAPSDYPVRQLLDDYIKGHLTPSRTLLSAIGCSNEVGEAILGHLPADIVATYNTHSYDKERREWLKRLDAHLEQLAR